MPEINFNSNSLAPSLKYEDNSFDFLYSVSVFTHLSEEMHYRWFKENLRIVRPGGIIMLTTHGDKYKLLPNELFRYEQGELVMRGNV